ncbi:hypothetical protein MJG53_018857 [Ovis ammon polii x Ovis aries]|uniref:Uncharacterized protein n=1 Tax=Ovis ammon polii x Ovis aries TaxID=2918886 RepID=A0ACB9U3E1_9CETA|nr:hypothetical protein MJG53_018857 [Ovis ammon polii x Ovis aries]
MRSVLCCGNGLIGKNKQSVSASSEGERRFLKSLFLKSRMFVFCPFTLSVLNTTSVFSIFEGENLLHLHMKISVAV